MTLFDPLRVITYNVRYFGHSTRGIGSTASSLKRIAACLATLRPLPDVVCLQEVETSSIRSTWMHPRRHPSDTQFDRLLEALHTALRGCGHTRETFDGQYFRAHNYRITDRTSFYTTGLAILIRRPLRLHRHNAERPHDITHRRKPRSAHASEAAPKGLKQTRICAHAVIEHPNGLHIDLFNTHLSLPAFLHSEFWTSEYRMGWGKNQLEEARQLADFVERERTSNRFLVMGDLNALPGSPVYNFLTQKLGWHDPLNHALGSDIEALRGFATAGFLHLRMHLDHIFSGPHIHWRDVDGSYPFGHSQSPFQGLSDHVPLIGRFTIDPIGAIEATQQL